MRSLAVSLLLFACGFSCEEIDMGTRTVINEEGEAVSEDVSSGPALEGQLITFNRMPVGRTEIVNARMTFDNPSRLEILRLETGNEDLAQLFTLMVGEEGVAGTPAGFSYPDFDVPANETYPIAPSEVFHNAFVIEWGAGGARHRTVVDAIPRQVLTLAGSFVKVTALNFKTVPVRMAAQVSLLPHGSHFNPTKTTSFRGLAANGGNLVSGFPGFAQRVYISRYPSADLAVRFTGNAVVYTGEVLIPAGADSPHILIPGGSNEIHVRNGATPLDFVSIIFEIGL
jgi:hypothetical protein